jgi:hypothetical protein
MPQVLNVRHLAGFSDGRPIIPADAIYIGRKARPCQLDQQLAFGA